MDFDDDNAILNLHRNGNVSVNDKPQVSSDDNGATDDNSQINSDDDMLEFTTPESDALAEKRLGIGERID